VAIFDAGSPAYQSTVGGTSTAVKIWSGTASALASISPAVTLRDLTVLNNGTISIYIGVGTTAAQLAGGVLVNPGGQVTMQGWVGTSNTTTNDLWGVGSTSVAGSFSTAAGLATLASVV
jgi:hypothetical protein